MENEKKRIKVFYIGDFIFPHGNAGAQLVYANGCILKELGYEVIFIGNSKELDCSVNIADTERRICGFENYTVPFKKRMSDIKNINKINVQLFDLLEKQKDEVLGIIFYGTPTLAITVWYIRKWCKKNNVLFIGNVVDISALSHGNLINRIFKWTDKNFLRLLFKVDSDGIIAVSEYIKKYFSWKDRPSIVLPPLVVEDSLPALVQNTGVEIKLIYAGVPFPVDGRKVDESSYKDRLDVVIELLGTVYRKIKTFRFDIYGITKEAYLRVITKHKQLLDEMEHVICFHGSTENDKILQLVAESDFTINFRNINRMTTAGFSTKFVESISCGTPAITTNTSDLSKYLIEGENGFFIDIEKWDEATERLQDILSLERNVINEMKAKCYNSKIFSYKKRTEDMRRFLEDILSDNNR